MMKSKEETDLLDKQAQNDHKIHISISIFYKHQNIQFTTASLNRFFPYKIFLGITCIFHANHIISYDQVCFAQCCTG